MLWAALLNAPYDMERKITRETAMPWTTAAGPLPTEWVGFLMLLNRIPHLNPLEWGITRRASKSSLSQNLDTSSRESSTRWIVWVKCHLKAIHETTISWLAIYCNFIATRHWSDIKPLYHYCSFGTVVIEWLENATNHSWGNDLSHFAWA